MRRRVVASILWCSLFAQPIGAQPDLSFTEDFTTTTYMDASTDVDWDTSTGEIRLFEFQPSVGVGSTMPDMHAYEVVPHGRQAIVAGGVAGLVVLDGGFPWNVIGSTSLPDRAVGLDVVGRYAYVACGPTGVQVVDLADPTSPVRVGEWGPSSGARRVDAWGSRLYVADETALRILDIGDPTTPLSVGSLSVACLDVAVEGYLAYVVTGDGKLMIVDVSEPGAPISLGDVATGEQSVAVAVLDDHAYVADRAAGLVIVDIADPAWPVLVSTTDMPDQARDLDVDGNFVYVAYGGGVAIVDAADPGQPDELAARSTPGTAESVAVYGALGLIADGDEGLRVLELDGAAWNYESMAVESQPLAGVPREMLFSGDVALVRFAEGFHLLDVSGVGSPQLLSTHEGPGAEITSWAVSDDVVYYSTEETYYDDVTWVFTVDISDPVHPEPGEIALQLGVDTWIAFLDVQDDRLYVTTDGNERGLGVIDVSPGTRPGLMSFYDCGTSALGRVAAMGGHVVTEGGIFDATDPISPRPLTAIEPSEDCVIDYEVEGLAVYQDIYCAPGVSGIELTRLNPLTGQLLAEGSVSPGYVDDIFVHGDRLYAAIGTTVAAFTNFMMSFEPPFYLDPVHAVGVRDDRLFVAGGGSLTVMHWRQRRYDLTRHTARSLRINPSGGPDVVAVRLTTEGAPRIDWRVTGDGGSSWTDCDPAEPYFRALGWPGDDLRWEATHIYAGHGENPSCRDLRVEWRYDHGPIFSVADVPGDQGGRVRLRWLNSGHDALGEVSPVTEYVVFRRIDESSMMRLPEGTTLRGERSGEMDFPPGDWDIVGTYPAMLDDSYSVIVPTLADSTISGGMHWSVFFVRALTELPGVRYDCPPDSGYSVDDLEPAVPVNVAFSAPGILSWDEAAEADFAYHTIYGSDTATFGENVTSIGYTIESTYDVSQNEFDYYHVTTSDHAGNESGAATVAGDVVSIEDPTTTPLPLAIGGARPNPFRSETAIVFDLPAPERVDVIIFDADGRLVRAVTDRAYPSGESRVIWNGTDDLGRTVGPGVYFLRIRVGGVEVARRVVRVR